MTNITNWDAVKKKGILRFIIVNGILLFGVPVTIATAIIRFYTGTPGTDSWQVYLMSNSTWIGFILQALVSGIIFGAIMWFVNDRAAKKRVQAPATDGEE